MTNLPKGSDKGLRGRAEERLLKIEGMSSEAEKSKLLHELYVHQIELEMQNSELYEARIAESEALRRYTELFEFAPLAYFILNSDAEIISVNLTGTALLAQDRSAVVGSSLLQYVSSAQRDILINTLSTAINKYQKVSVELSLNVGSEEVWVNVELKPDSMNQRCLVAMNDITSRKNAEIEMRLSAAVYSSLTEAIMVVGPNDEILAVNPSFTVLTGYSQDEAIGQLSTLIQSLEHNSELQNKMWSEIDHGKWEGEDYLLRKNGEEYVAWLSISSIYNQDKQLTHRVATFSDISEKKRQAEIIRKQANFDYLTGLPNRQLFQDRLKQSLQRITRSGKKLALLSMDIDKFKDVNDSFGHRLGDDLLIEASNRISNCLRESDTVARLGGDEFILIMEELDDLSTIQPLASRILEVMAKPFELDQSFAYVSVSIGVAVYPDDADSDEELINHSDSAMYAAKKDGRNRVHFFTPYLHKQINRKLFLSNELREALSKRELIVFYQPMVDLKTGFVHKAEALLRWNHSSLGAIYPTEFIPIAEETDQIVHIGNWVFHQVSQQALVWRSRFDADFQISINKSPAQFTKSHNQGDWLNYLSQIGLQPEALTVEITEGLLMDDSEKTNQQLLQLSEAGIEISLDDFGTGYSSLSYLKKYHVDYLKVDKSFVNGLEKGSDEMALCEAIVVMAHKLGLKVIAEGIETKVQRDLLLAAGCDYGQGYYFSEAVHPDEFESYFGKSLVL